MIMVIKMALNTSWVFFVSGLGNEEIKIQTRREIEISNFSQVRQ